MAQILDGKIVRDQIAQELKNEISRLRSKCRLVIIQVGNLPESNAYIRQKVLFGEKIGAIVEHIKLDEKIEEPELISQLPASPAGGSTFTSQLDIHGIIIQQPLPNHLNKDKIIDAIDPVKDVDGQTSTNIKLLFEGKISGHPGAASDTAIGSRSTPRKDSISASWRIQNDHMEAFSGFIPATTKGILTLLDYYKIPIPGKHVVVIGRSSLVGKPTALAFLNRDATVTICHSKTQNLRSITKTADILIVAAGKPKLINKSHVSKNQVVIDVGINVLPQQPKLGVGPLKSKLEAELPTSKLVGDVDSDSVKTVVAAISPVPGGIGPMTVASLFQNLLEAYKRVS